MMTDYYYIANGNFVRAKISVPRNQECEKYIPEIDRAYEKVKTILPIDTLATKNQGREIIQKLIQTVYNSFSI